MEKRSKPVSSDTDRKIEGKSTKQEGAKRPDETIPHVGKPLDGSQYHDVVEEQKYSEQRPAPAENKPGRAG